MLGRTNAGVNSTASQWYAFIQVSTDANAVITAVNPAGNSYTKTADGTGSCIFIVAYPGTYTISETGAQSQTAVVADYGVTYSVSIYLPAPTGTYIIQGGNYQVNMSRAAAVPISYSHISQNTPYVSTGVSKTNPVTGVTENWLLFQIENANTGGCLFTTNKINTTGKSKLYINMYYDQPYANLYFGIFSIVSGGWISVISDTQASYQTSTISTYLNISFNGECYIGVYGINDSNHSLSTAYIKDLYYA